MKNKHARRNLYFYQWDHDFFSAAKESDRITCSVRDFEFDDNLEAFSKLRNFGVEVYAYLPILWKDADNSDTKEFGELVDGIYIANAGQLEWAKATGKRIVGDAGLNVFNAYSAMMYNDLGLDGVTLSYELSDGARDLVEYLDENCEADMEIEILRYGRVPAMVSEYCPLAGAKGIKGSACGSCMEHNPVYLKDGMGERYPVMLEDSGCTSLILSKTALNRKNSAKSISLYENRTERIIVFDETPAFIARV